MNSKAKKKVQKMVDETKQIEHLSQCMLQGDHQHYTPKNKMQAIANLETAKSSKRIVD